MHRYKVFVQNLEHDFTEIAQTTTEEDGNTILHRYQSGMVTEDGKIVTTKNLTHPADTPTLFNIKETTA